MYAMGLEKLTRLAKVDYGFPFDSNLFTDNSVYMPLIRIRDIKPAKASTYYEGEYSDRYVVRKGDILVGMDGEFNLERWNDRDGLLNQRILRIKAIDGLSDESYLYHLLAPLFKNIEKKVQGGSVKHLSAKIVENLYIPYVDFEEQVLIGKQLDTFTALISNLESELDMRRKQYEHYRNQLYGNTLELLLDKAKRGEIEMSTLSEVGTFTRGRRFVRTDIMTEGTPCIHYGDMYTYYGVSAKSTPTYLLPEVAAKLRFAQENDVVIVGAGENNEDIGIGVAWLGQDDVAVHDACYIFKHQMNPLYISYYLRTDVYHKQIKKYVFSGKICSISSDGIGKAVIPIPSLKTQQEIVEKLDTFEDLIQSLETEIKLRKQQYEYYREKLLTFE